MMNRTLSLCLALGWQGGTIHQVSDEIGIDVDTILENEGETAPDVFRSGDHCGGWFAARTCSLAHNREKVFPKNRGNLHFWLGVSDGVRLAEKLGTMDNWRKNYHGNK